MGRMKEIFMEMVEHEYNGDHDAHLQDMARQSCEEFIKEDFAGAGEWLAGQTLGPAYDEAIQDYAMSAAKDNPEAALAWVDRISDERLRNYTLGRLKPREKKE